MIALISGGKDLRPAEGWGRRRLFLGKAGIGPGVRLTGPGRLPQPEQHEHRRCKEEAADALGNREPRDYKTAYLVSPEEFDDRADDRVIHDVEPEDLPVERLLPPDRYKEEKVQELGRRLIQLGWMERHTPEGKRGRVRKDHRPGNALGRLAIAAACTEAADPADCMPDRDGRGEDIECLPCGQAGFPDVPDCGGHGKDQAPVKNKPSLPYFDHIEGIAHVITYVGQDKKETRTGDGGEKNVEGEVGQLVPGDIRLLRLPHRQSESDQEPCRYQKTVGMDGHGAYFNEYRVHCISLRVLTLFIITSPSADNRPIRAHIVHPRGIEV